MDKPESEKQEWNLETRNQNGSAFLDRRGPCVYKAKEPAMGWLFWKHFRSGILTNPRPKRPRPNKRAVEPASGAFPPVLTSTGSVRPVSKLMTSATKMLPLAFAAVRSAIVASATWNTILPVKASDPPFPQVVHSIPNETARVPSPLKVPVAVAKVWPETVWSTVISPTETPVPLNLKAMKSAAPVFANKHEAPEDEGIHP